MKLRIKGNSVRLRLTRPDIQELAHRGYLEERTHFGSSTFIYSIECKEVEQLTVNFGNDKLSVFIPAHFLLNWADDDIVGHEGHMPVSHTESLYLLVEKDFKCLDRKAEDESANYNNPNDRHV